MGKQLVLAVALVVALGAIAAISFTIGTRSADTAGVSESVSLSGTDGIVPLNNQPEVVRSDADQPGTPAEGIEVHGRWKIEVTEPDGRFVSLTEFDNVLVGSGIANLGKILGRQGSTGEWSITVSSPTGQPCNSTGGSEISCLIREVGTSFPNIFSNLVVDVPISGVNRDAVVLSGSITVANSTSITHVGTKLAVCPSSSAPDDFVLANCNTQPFTNKELADAVSVIEDQIVNVTVVISFS